MLCFRRPQEILCIAALVALGTPPGVSLAENDDGEKRFGQEVLEILRDEGKIDRERYEELKKKEEAEHEARDAASGPKAFKLKYSNGLQWNRNDGMVKLKLGGRIQADFATIHAEGALNDAVPNGDGEGTEFRRSRLYMSGELYKRVVFKAQYDFTDGNSNFNDVYIGLKGLGFLGTVKVGHMKQPFSLEELTSSKYITFMERSLGSLFHSSRDFGLMASNPVLDNRMTWAFGIFNPSDGFGDDFSTETEFDITGRVTGLPLYEEGGERLVHLGLSVQEQIRDAITQRFRQRPEVHLAQRYVDTGNYVSDGATNIAVELGFVCGPFNASGEWKQNWTQRVDGKDFTAFAGHIQASWFLTGETRPYDTKKGTWARVVPKNSFNPAEGQWGAFEIGARFSHIDLNRDQLNGGKERNATLALNWYLFSNLRIMLNYVYADVRSTGDFLRAGASAIDQSGSIHTFQSRAQLEF